MIWVGLFLLSTVLGAPVVSNHLTALDKYVAQYDPNFRYEVFYNTSMQPVPPNWDGYIVKMYSQQWLTPQDWNRGNPNTSDAIWWHWMTIVVPHKLDPRHSDTGVLWITGGSNNDGPPTNPVSEDNGILAALCEDMGLVGAALYQIPNQPIYFTDENPPRGRTEDAFIAWTWKHFLENPGDPDTLETETTEWLARLPMTKASVRAMDTLADFRKDHQTITKFFVSGASKRGWTTWTTALVDDRVVGAIPIVLDVLHMVPSLHHMWRAYGGWTYAFKDYYDVNLTKHIDTPEFEWLCMVVDPFYYLADPARFKMPKLAINAAGDEFLQGDNDHYWWNDMPQPKYRQVCQNAEHSEITGIPEIMGNVAAWGNAMLNGVVQPNFTWTIDPKDGHITVYNDPNLARPVNVTMWHAPAFPKHGLRDWRLIAGYPTNYPQAVIWHPIVINETAPGSNMWIASVPEPDQGWHGFFVEVFYAGIPPFYDPTATTYYRMTTQTSYIPYNVWPFPDCYGEACYGTLV